MVANQTINIKDFCQVENNLLTKSVSALLPPFWGSVSAANGGSVDSVCRSGCAFQPDARKPLYVDGFDLLPFVLSGSSVEPDSTNAVKP